MNNESDNNTSPARLSDAERAQMLRGQGTDLSSADDQDAPALQTAEDLPRQLYGREADRHGALTQ